MLKIRAYGVQAWDFEKQLMCEFPIREKQR
jgi:hypothetical protein